MDKYTDIELYGHWSTARLALKWKHHLLVKARNEIMNKIPVEKRDCELYDSINRAIGQLAE